jgi:hypothetical protein
MSDMLRPTLVMVLLTLVPPAFAQEQVAPAGPRGQPPRMIAVTLDDDGNPVIEDTVTRYVTEARERTVVVNGKEQRERYTVAVPTTTTTRQPLTGKGVQVYTADGKKVAAKDIAARISGPTPVLLSTDGKMVDRFYLRLVRDTTLVVVMPQPAVPVPGVAPPPPPIPVPVPKLDVPKS